MPLHAMVVVVGYATGHLAENKNPHDSCLSETPTGRRLRRRSCKPDCRRLWANASTRSGYSEVTVGYLYIPDTILTNW